MNISLEKKLEIIMERYEEINRLLSDTSFMVDQNQVSGLLREYAELKPIVHCFKSYQQVLQQQQHAKEMLVDKDSDIRIFAEKELTLIKKQLTILRNKLKMHLLPKDVYDQRNVFLEIRAGSGGNEASIFAGDLFRMYARFVENQRWVLEIVSQNIGEQGGFKEIIVRILGKNVYATLKFESGVHRVQRVPVTESQGRVHTSACTVAVLPEVDEVDEIIISPSDLRIDTYRSSGAGGQHVNRTDSAVRITHIPSGTVVECQDERSQHKNKARAMSLLRAKLLTVARQNQQNQQAAERRQLVGSGDRSERIRTYNYSQGRVTDHRINLTLYKLNELIAGDLLEIIDALRQEYQADLLIQNDN